MAESRRYGPTEPLSLEQILKETHERWLRPMEICEILRNHEKFRLTSEPPNGPPAGSLFLFDRKVLRCFRKDGHRWRKKKDGKTIKEAHEKLKAGSVDVLHCLYAHGEDNENFQRRSYWMLHEQLENIVLVHYREVKEGRDFLLLQPHSQDNSSFQEKLPSTSKVDAPVGRANSDEAGELKKLDSFGRLMDKEIGGDCDDSLMASDSGNYWNTFDTENEKEVSSVLDHMQLNFDSMGPSLYQDQLFSISVFAPDWAYSGIETKVLITGTFLGKKKQSGSLKWGCMFGEIEAPAEVLADNVMRCQVPFHAPGRVPLYITCSNRLACSEVREFEYRENPQETSSSITVNTSPEDEEPEDEVQFRIRLGRMLDVGSERKGLTCYVVHCQKCWFRKYITSLKTKSEIFSEMVENAIMFHEGYSVVDPGDALIENVLKSKLYDLLICRAHEGGKGLNILDNEGLGLIHLAAALGFAWAMSPIIYADVSPDFRDARGKTALHWASYYGREGAVIELIRLRASAGAVDDPTSASPGGQTAADLASSRGHKGIAGYLAKEDLASHLSSLMRPENAVESVTADIVAEKAFETAAEKAFESVLSPQQTDEEHSLKVSLATVRKSARAVALIQAAFRAPSFRPRQLTKSVNDISESSVALVALGLLNKVQKVSHFDDYLHSAATKVQQKYRGWKGRKEFLKIRNRVVKIQAYVRGHQVRKQYKKIVWSVSIVEKAILRWRRKGNGLRGFRKQETLPNSEKNDEDDFLRIGRKQKFAGVEKALTRVESMVRDPKGRDQYMSLFSKFEGPRHPSYSCLWRKIRLNGKYCGPLALRT